MKTMLLDYVKYNLWANSKLLNFCMTHTHQNILQMEMKSSFSTISKTFLHIWDAEFIWLSRLAGESPKTWPSKDNTNIVLSDLTVNSTRFVALVNEKKEEFLTQSTTYKNMKNDEFTSENNIIIMHCMNHSTFHRGQIISMLRNAGIDKDLPQSDFISWDRLRA